MLVVDVDVEVVVELEVEVTVEPVPVPPPEETISGEPPQDGVTAATNKPPTQIPSPMNRVALLMMKLTCALPPSKA